jgi:type II secretion system protein N
MNPLWLRYIGVAAGSVLWGVVVFFAGVQLAFPSEAAKQWLRYQVESQSNEQWTFEASDVDAWRLSGVTAKDLTVYKVARRVRAGDEPTPATPFAHADRLSVRLEILPFLASFGKARRLDYKTTVFGSDITGVIGRTETVTQVLARTSSLDLSKVPISGDSWSVDLIGKANLDMDLEIDGEEIDKSEGHIRLDVHDLALVGGEAMGSQFSDIASDVFPASFSEAVLEFEVKEGKAEVTKGRFISEPVELEIAGNIQLRKDLERSRIDLEITLKFNESLDRLARIAPMLSAGRDADGTYHLGATGTVLSPRLREDRTATKRKTSTTGADSDGATTSSQSAEEREKAREERLERLKERRERMRQQRESTGNQNPPQEAPLIDPSMEEMVPPMLDDGGPMDMEDEGPPHEAGYVDEPPPAEPEPVEGPYIED